MENALEFSKESKSDMEAFAIIAAEWTRQGMTFKTSSSFTHISVKLTGGF
jgi:hypothetical protein